MNPPCFHWKPIRKLETKVTYIKESWNPISIGGHLGANTRVEFQYHQPAMNQRHTHTDTARKKRKKMADGGGGGNRCQSAGNQRDATLGQNPSKIHRVKPNSWIEKYMPPIWWWYLTREEGKKQNKKNTWQNDETETGWDARRCSFVFFPFCLHFMCLFRHRRGRGWVFWFGALLPLIALGGSREVAFKAGSDWLKGFRTCWNGLKRISRRVPASTFLAGGLGGWGRREGWTCSSGRKNPRRSVFPYWHRRLLNPI